ncbi:hypothetical protein PFAG_04546 [Plasmodium falciparum Santa Lucia]|uniref:Uncharacterized protein n=1 Tax=Plasmodium falciparum Santa Lucia TaxID=478859 RepID=W7FE05_PLAFA|nr:hypothetical protein PFAG_04546 [Plasmodium falciparum Santa Lucia]
MFIHRKKEKVDYNIFKKIKKKNGFSILSFIFFFGYYFKNIYQYIIYIYIYIDIYNILFYLKSYNFVLLYFKNNFLPTKIVYNYIIFYYSN